VDSATVQRDSATVARIFERVARYMYVVTQSSTKTFILHMWRLFVHKKREIACVDHAIIVYVRWQRDGVCGKLRSVLHATSDTRDGGHRGELRRLSHFSEGQSHCVAWIVERHSRYMKHRHTQSSTKFHVLIIPSMSVASVMVYAANCEVSIIPLQILGMEDIAASSEDSATSQRDKATVWLGSSNAILDT
jgi:hypothetical protein